MLVSLAWKNVFRNKLRSILVIASIAIGLTGGIFYMAFSNGMAQSQINNSINTYVSNLQIHNPKYLLNDEIEYAIDKPEEKIEKIKNLTEVAGVCSRIKSAAMIATAETGTGVHVFGVDPEKEKFVTDLHKRIIKGTYFAKGMKYPVLLGKKLAHKLNVKPKSKVVITIQNTHGEITSGLFRVAGIFDAENSIFEENNVFLAKKDLASLIDFDTTKATEIAVLLKRNEFTENVKNKLSKIFAREIEEGKLIIRTWAEIQPMLKMLNDMTIQFTMIFLVIILVALGFGVVNTMLMSVMERRRELGMLMAIGMSKGRIFLMILIETVFLSLSGAVIGIATSALVNKITAREGIDLSRFAEGLNAWGYSTLVRPQLEIEYYLLIALLAIFAALFASVFPARKALKINPAQAMRQ